MTYPSKSVRKRFDPVAYKKSDGLAKECITKYLERIGHDVLPSEEDYGVDLQSTYWDGAVLHEYCHEVEMKHMWEGDWPTIWKDIHIPFRKKRLLTQIYGDDWNKGKNKYVEFYFYIIRGDCKKAWRMHGTVVQNSPVVEVPNRAVRKGEYFFKVPVDKAELIDLGVKNEQGNST